MINLKLIEIQEDADLTDLDPQDYHIVRSVESGKFWFGSEKKEAKMQGGVVRVQMPEVGDYEVTDNSFDAIIQTNDNDILLTDSAIHEGFILTVTNASGSSIDVKMKSGETDTIYGGTITLTDGQFCTLTWKGTVYYRIG